MYTWDWNTNFGNPRIDFLSEAVSCLSKASSATDRAYQLDLLACRSQERSASYLDRGVKLDFILLTVLSFQNPCYLTLITFLFVDQIRFTSLAHPFSA